MQYGPFGYTNHNNFNRDMEPPNFHREFKENIKISIARSDEYFVDSYKRKYAEEEHYPMWMVVETMTFGLLALCYRNLKTKDRTIIAQRFGVHHTVLNSWLRSLSYARNICAHHLRLWNRPLSVKCSIPRYRNRPEFHEPARLENDKYFSVVTVIKFLVDIIDPDNQMKEEFLNLLGEYPDTPQPSMGMPENWENYRLWR